MVSKKKRTIFTWVVIAVAAMLIGFGAFFGYRAYQGYLADKIYKPNETASFSDFSFEVTKAEFKPVNLELNQEYVDKYNGIVNNENCDSQSKEKSWDVFSGQFSQLGASDFNKCIRRNNARDAIKEYLSVNKQLVIDYKIAAKSNITSKDIHITITPDSGRNVSGNDSGVYLDVFGKNSTELTFTYPDAPGPTYVVSPGSYKAYHQSELTGDINRGIERTGYIYTDIRNTESIVDLKVTYNGQTRIVRISK